MKNESKEVLVVMVVVTVSMVIASKALDNGVT